MRCCLCSVLRHDWNRLWLWKLSFPQRLSLRLSMWRTVAPPVVQVSIQSRSNTHCNLVPVALDAALCFDLRCFAVMWSELKFLAQWEWVLYTDNELQIESWVSFPNCMYTGNDRTFLAASAFLKRGFVPRQGPDAECSNPALPTSRLCPYARDYFDLCHLSWALLHTVATPKPATSPSFHDCGIRTVYYFSSYLLGTYDIAAKLLRYNIPDSSICPPGVLAHDHQ